MVLVLDITRSVSRAKNGHSTGIDRVESKYFERFLELPEVGWFVAKVPGGTFFLSRENARIVWHLLRDDSATFPFDLRAKLAVRRHNRLRVAESAVRRLGQSSPQGFGEEFEYFNVGHSNLTASWIKRLRVMGCKSFVAMLHDTIPLDHPEWSSTASSRSFPGKLGVMGGADLLICVSKVTAQRAEFWLKELGAEPPILVAHLATDPRENMAEVRDMGRRFLALGTIEPRKNHKLLLAVWQGFHETLPLSKVPFLDVVGARGWRNEGVFRQLDRLKKLGRVVEHGPLGDEEVARMMSQSRALLFPSLAEGFGLPVLEAVQAGLPVICSDLPVLRETAGNVPLYLPPHDAHSWAKAIIGQKEPIAQATQRATFPNWDDHFNLVFSRLLDLPAKPA